MLIFPKNTSTYYAHDFLLLSPISLELLSRAQASLLTAATEPLITLMWNNDEMTAGTGDGALLQFHFVRHKCHTLGMRPNPVLHGVKPSGYNRFLI